MKCNKRQHSIEIKQSKQQKTLEKIVKNATQMWCADPIHLRNPLQFLQLTSHCINDNHMEASMAHKLLTLSTEQDESNGRHLHFPKSNSIRRTKSMISRENRKQFTTSNEPALPIDVNQMKYTLDHTKPMANTRDPPPLAFYPKIKGQPQKPIIFSATEPPPLVPIGRNFA